MRVWVQRKEKFGELLFFFLYAISLTNTGVGACVIFYEVLII